MAKQSFEVAHDNITEEQAQDKSKLGDLIAVSSSEYFNKLWEDYQVSTTIFRRKLNDYYRQYRGIPNRRNYEGLANVFVNETLEACESITAQEVHTIFSEPKYVQCLGREATDEEKARLIQNTMMYFLDQMKFKSKILRHIRQKNKYGTTFAKLCWCYEEKDVTQRGPNGFEQTRKVTKNHPDLEYIDLLDLAVDPGKPDIEKMDWVIIRKRCTWDYIQDRVRRGLYSAEQVERINRGSNKSSEFMYNKQQRIGAVGINYYYFDDKEYEILEYWGKVPRWWVDDDIDINSPEAEEMVEAVGECLIGGPTLRLNRNPYWHQEKPFAMGHMIQVDDEAFGMGVCEISERLQEELNDKRNQLLDHATEQIAPPLIRNRASNIEKEQIKLAPFQIIDSDIAGDSALTPLKLGGNPTENVMMEERIKNDIRNTTGATNPVQGISSNKDQTAYEISTLQSRGSSRIDVGTIDFSDKFLKRAYKLMYSMVQQFVDKEMVIRIVGKDGIKWEQVTPEDLINDFDLVPKVATDVDNRTIMRNQMIQFVTGIAPFYPRVKIQKLVRKIYDLFGFDDGDEVIPAPDTEQGLNDLSIEEEIQVLNLGQRIEVKFYEDHMSKIQAFMKFLNQFGNQMSPKAQEAFKDAINQHMHYLQVMEQAAQAAQAAGAMPGTSPQAGGAGTPANPTASTPVSSTAQGQRDLTRT